MPRRLLLLLLSSFLFPCSAFAALPATGVIEIRASAAANNVNGGGYNSARGGTDYSLQDTAQLTNTDGSAVGTTTFTSLGSTFTSVMVGNYLHITASTGLTVGWYEIVTFTDANNVVLDRTPGTGTATTFYVGGAMSMNSTLDDDLFEIGVAGNKFWIKGNITLGEAVSTAASGGTQNPIVVEGYATTRGDGTTAANRPTVTQAANAWTGGGAFDFYNIIWTGTAATMFSAGAANIIVNCKFTNTSSTVDREAFDISSGDILAFNNEAVSYWGKGIDLSSSAVVAYGNYAHDSNVGIGMGWTTGDNTIIQNISADNVTAALTFTGNNTEGVLIANNTLYGAENTIGTGINFASGVTDVRVMNNIIYGFVTGVTHATATQTIGYDNYNDYNNNDTDVTNWQKGANDSTAAPGFTNVTQVTGTTGAFVAGGSKLVDLNKNFTTAGVAAGKIVYITGGTGSTTRKYLIDSISTTTNPNDTLNITIPASPGTNTTADKTYQITLGHDFSIGTNLKALGFPGVFQGGLTTGYMDIGGVQRQEAGGTTTDVFGMIQ